jgi:hypothetical protein
MPSGFRIGSTSTNANTGDFVPLSATAVRPDLASNAPFNTKITLIAGQNAIIQIDSNAGGTNTTYQSTYLTGVPAVGQWVDVGQIDPSRIWVRSAAGALANHVNWVCFWY